MVVEAHKGILADDFIQYLSSQKGCNFEQKQMIAAYH